MENWKERFEYIYVIEENKGEKYLRKYDHTTIVEELEYFISQELDKAREEGKRDATEKLRLAFHEVFFKSGELWFDYLFEDGDIEAEQDAREMVEEYWEEVVSKLKDNK